MKLRSDQSQKWVRKLVALLTRVLSFRCLLCSNPPEAWSVRRRWNSNSFNRMFSRLVKFLVLFFSTKSMKLAFETFILVEKYWCKYVFGKKTSLKSIRERHGETFSDPWGGSQRSEAMKLPPTSLQRPPYKCSLEFSVKYCFQNS